MRKARAETQFVQFDIAVKIAFIMSFPDLVYKNKDESQQRQQRILLTEIHS